MREQEVPSTHDLVADNSEVQRELLSELLEAQGCGAVWTERGARVLKVRNGQRADSFPRNQMTARSTGYRDGPKRRQILPIPPILQPLTSITPHLQPYPKDPWTKEALTRKGSETRPVGQFARGRTAGFVERCYATCGSPGRESAEEEHRQ